MSPSMERSPYAIRVRDLTKVFRLYDSPLDLLRERITGRKRHIEHMALDRVSLDIRHGETVGIIGRNGAGKSTLLKIIAGVLDHDSGTVEVDGRVSALLELGSGFNVEYTGRENILFGGMCLGMSRSEILEKMDSIIAFAELEEYIDQPLKTFSSGMQSRLAFATAIAVDAEVLIVDEALAVGDVFFQAKCMAHMRKMQQRGATILFVSHSPESVKQMCDRGILLDHGQVLLDGDTLHVTERYFNTQLEGHDVSRAEKSATQTPAVTPKNLDTLSGGAPCADSSGPSPFLGKEEFEQRAIFERVTTGDAHFINVQLMDSRGNLRSSYEYGEKVTLRLLFQVKHPIHDAMISYSIRTTAGIDAVWADTRESGIDLSSAAPGGLYALEWQFGMNLQHGNYFIRCGISIPSSSSDIKDWKFIDIVPHAAVFSILPRKSGMIGGLTTWKNQVCLHAIEMDNAKTPE